MTRTAREYMGERAIEALRRPALEEARGLPASLYTSREFFDLEQRRLFPRTWAGIAFDTGMPAPTTLNFLPEDHIVVLRESRIVPHPEDAWALMREERGSIPAPRSEFVNQDQAFSAARTTIAAARRG